MLHFASGAKSSAYSVRRRISCLIPSFDGLFLTGTIAEAASTLSLTASPLTGQKPGVRIRIDSRMNEGVRQKAKTTTRSITERARQAADAVGFGLWERSLRVNGSIDRDALINGAIVLFIAPCLPIATGFFPPEGPWWIRAFCIAVGAIFLCAGLVLLSLAWRRRRAGPALIHLFGNGVVLERTKGPLFTLPYADTLVDHVRWREMIDGAESKQLRRILWITLSR